MRNLAFFSLLFPAAPLIVLIAPPSGAQDAVPMLVNYQGELHSPTTGEPVPDGSHDTVFRIYGVQSSGTPLWTGTHSTANGNPAAVKGGILSVILGSGSGNTLESSVFNGADRWLEIQVGGETLLPRQRLTSAAYSLVSENSRLLSGREASQFANSTHAHSGSEITTGTVSEARIDPLIARDTETNAAVGAHKAIADAHHTKTTKFTELTDVAADAQIPGSIARDSEVMPMVLANDGAGSALDADKLDGLESATLEESAEIDAKITAHAAVASAHHTRYTDAEARAAMGAKADTNPLNHDKTASFSELTGTVAEAQIPASVARDSEIMPVVLANDGTGSGLDADRLDGADGTSLEESAEIDADIAAHKAITDAHHARYTDAEARAAMGPKADGNPLNHDKTTSLPWSAIASVPAGFADGIDNEGGGDITGVAAGAGLSGGGDSGSVTLSAAFGGSGSANTIARSDHNHGATYWMLTGNSGISGPNFLGTTDDQPLELRVNNARALRLEPNATSPNIVAGYQGNAVHAGALGGTVAGGGSASNSNWVTDNYGTVGGGISNQAGDSAGTTTDARGATVAGGWLNAATGNSATGGGGSGNTASGELTTVGGGANNTASGLGATVAGGFSNSASGNAATVGGGGSNSAGEMYATVSGGMYNTASGNYATVAGAIPAKRKVNTASPPEGAQKPTTMERSSGAIARMRTSPRARTIKSRSAALAACGSLAAASVRTRWFPGCRATPPGISSVTEISRRTSSKLMQQKWSRGSAGCPSGSGISEATRSDTSAPSHKSSMRCSVSAARRRLSTPATFMALPSPPSAGFTKSSRKRKIESPGSKSVTLNWRRG